MVEDLGGATLLIKRSLISLAVLLATPWILMCFDAHTRVTALFRMALTLKKQFDVCFLFFSAMHFKKEA